MAKFVTKEMLVAANGKRIGGSSKYWIYVTNHKAYNEGILTGIYLYFPFSKEDIDEAFKLICVGSEFADKNGNTYEDYFILNYEAPFEIAKYDFLPDLIGKFDSTINKL